MYSGPLAIHLPPGPVAPPPLAPDYVKTAHSLVRWNSGWMCIACRKVCFSDNAARKMCFTHCVGVGVGLVLSSQEEGRMIAEGKAPISQPAPTQPVGVDSDVFLLPPRPPEEGAPRRA